MQWADVRGGEGADAARVRAAQAGQAAVQASSGCTAAFDRSWERGRGCGECLQPHAAVAPELGCMVAESQPSSPGQTLACPLSLLPYSCPSPYNCPATRRYPSGESYMDVIQRLEPVVTGEGGA